MIFIFTWFFFCDMMPFRHLTFRGVLLDMVVEEET